MLLADPAVWKYTPSADRQKAMNLSSAADGGVLRDAPADQPAAGDDHPIVSDVVEAAVRLFGGEPATREKGACSCVLLPLSIDAAEHLLAIGHAVRDEDLADDGRELDPHVTVFYGLQNTSPAEPARVLAGFRPFEYRFGLFDVFEQPEHDVLYASVVSPDLHALHGKLKDLPHAETYPEYIPHATVAYLKKGMGRVYADVLNKGGATIPDGTATTVRFSDPDKRVTELSLGGPTVPVGVVELEREKGWDSAKHPRGNPKNKGQFAKGGGGGGGGKSAPAPKAGGGKGKPAPAGGKGGVKPPALHPEAAERARHFKQQKSWKDKVDALKGAWVGDGMKAESLAYLKTDDGSHMKIRNADDLKEYAAGNPKGMKDIGSRITDLTDADRYHAEQDARRQGPGDDASATKTFHQGDKPAPMPRGKWHAEVQRLGLGKIVGSFTQSPANSYTDIHTPTGVTVRLTDDQMQQALSAGKLPRGVEVADPATGKFASDLMPRKPQPPAAPGGTTPEEGKRWLDETAAKRAGADKANTLPVAKKLPSLAKPVQAKVTKAAQPLAAKAKADPKARQALRTADKWADYQAAKHAKRVAHRFGGDVKKAEKALSTIIRALCRAAVQGGGPASASVNGVKLSVNRRQKEMTDDLFQPGIADEILAGEADPATMPAEVADDGPAAQPPDDPTVCPDCGGPSHAVRSPVYHRACDRCGVKFDRTLWAETKGYPVTMPLGTHAVTNHAGEFIRFAPVEDAVPADPTTPAEAA